MKGSIMPVERASEELILYLIDKGYLYVDDNGVHCAEPAPRRYRLSENEEMER